MINKFANVAILRIKSPRSQDTPEWLATIPLLMFLYPQVPFRGPYPLEVTWRRHRPRFATSAIHVSTSASDGPPRAR
jgi:hypothetical protein